MSARLPLRDFVVIARERDRGNFNGFTALDALLFAGRQFERVCDLPERVLPAHCEEGTRPSRVAGPPRDELRLLADWLGLERVVLSRRRGLVQLLRQP